MEKTLFQSMTRKESEIDHHQNDNTSVLTTPQVPAVITLSNVQPVQDSKQEQVAIPQGTNLVPYEPNFNDNDSDFDLLKILENVEKETKNIVPNANATTNNTVMTKIHQKLLDSLQDAKLVVSTFILATSKTYIYF